MPQATPQTTDDPIVAVRHFALGAVPIAIAAIAVILQLANPYAGPDHRWLLSISVVALMMFSMTIWLWCTVNHISHQFAERHDKYAAAQRKRFDTLEAGLLHLEDITLRNERSLQGLHKRLDRLLESSEELATENEHLRRLILAAEPPQQLNGQRLGPRGR